VNAVVLASGSTTGWAIGYTVTIIVVLVVVALVVPILMLAHQIGNQAGTINDSLGESEHNTAALKQLNTTIEHADVIVDGLRRGRQRLGG
jgi:predicted PurR-regulated permease PerM